ncbi:MAG: AMP-binding protein [Agarilytica sp.]
MNIAAVLQKSGKAYDTLPSVICGNESISFRELSHRTQSIAGALRNQYALSAGDRVAIISQNCPHYIELLFSIWHAGLVAVPINAKLHPKELRYILQHSGTKLCFTGDKHTADCEHLPQEIDSLAHILSIGSEHYLQLYTSTPATITERDDNDPAWLFYTSGTTGKPKGAMQSHKNLRSSVQAHLTDIDNILVGDKIAHIAPMSHGGGYCILPYIVNGGTQVIPKSGEFHPEEVFDLIETHERLSFFAVPTIIKRLTEHVKTSPTDISHLKSIIYSGSPMYQEDLNAAHHAFGFRLVQVYGQGECPMAIAALSKYHHDNTAHPQYTQRLASVGTPMLGVEIKITDDNHTPVLDGQAGEIMVKSDTVISGYFENPEATHNTIIDGWLKTGDIGIQNPDGFITLTDRSKDVIISGGSNIYPREIEEVLIRHPDTKEVSVIGQKDRKWGEIIVAFIVLKENKRQEEYSAIQASIDNFCTQEIARFKRPKEYHFIPSLPKNATGKVLKTELRKLIEKYKH